MVCASNFVASATIEISTVADATKVMWLLISGLERPG